MSILTLGLGSFVNPSLIVTLGLLAPSTPAQVSRVGGDDVPRRKSPERGFDLAQWKARQIDLEGSIRETYTALVHGPLVKNAKEIVSPYVQTNEVDWKALARDDEAVEQMLLLQEEEEAVMLLLLQ